MLPMLLTVLAIPLVIVLVIYAVLVQKKELLRKIGVIVLVWTLLYSGLLLGTSLSSREVVLGLNQEKHFCGFYLDCHLSVLVVSVAKTKTLGNPQQPLKTANGIYYIVTVKVASDARAATLRFENPIATVIDEQGRVYGRFIEGEQALEREQGRVVPFSQDVGPNYSYTYAKELVFDLPTNLINPRLLVTKGHWVERLTELFLMGDEDSMFHKKAVFRLEPY